MLHNTLPSLLPKSNFFCDFVLVKTLIKGNLIQSENRNQNISGVDLSHLFETAYLEITNICNRRCEFCHGTSRPAGFIDVSEFERRLKEVSAVAKYVYLHVLGEPLCHPDFPELLCIAEALGAPLKITTNGDLIDSDAGKALMNSNIVSQINFSVHALEAADEFEKLDRLISFVRQSLVLKPERYINFRLWNGGGNEKSFNTNVIAKCNEAFSANASKPAGRRSCRVAGRFYLNFDNRFNWPDMADPVQADSPCHGMLDQFAVLCGGEVTLCCLDADGRTVLGNLRVTPLNEILNSPRADEIRAGWLAGKPVDELCRRCSFRLRFGG